MPSGRNLVFDVRERVEDECEDFLKPYLRTGYGQASKDDGGQRRRKLVPDAIE